MVAIAIIIGCILGAIIGINAPTISYTFSNYLAIAIIAALDSVFGGITSVINKKFSEVINIFRGRKSYPKHKQIIKTISTEISI